MGKVRVSWVEGEGDKGRYEVSVADGEGKAVLKAIDLVAKAVANSIAKDLANVGGQATVVMNLVDETTEKVVWIQSGERFRLSIIDETEFTLTEGGDEDGRRFEEVREILQKQVDVEWIPDHETPGRENRTPTKGIPGSG